MAATLKVAVCPAVTDWFAGCVLMIGAVAAGFTVSVAELLVALPAVFVTTTLNSAPLSVVAVVGVVYLDDVAPAMAVVPFIH